MRINCMQLAQLLAELTLNQTIAATQEVFSHSRCLHFCAAVVAHS
jgi:hypothetical protein